MILNKNKGIKLKYLFAGQINDNKIKNLQKDANKYKRDEYYQIDSIDSYNQMQNIKRILSKNNIEATHTKYQDRKKIFKSRNLIKMQMGRTTIPTSYRIKFKIKAEKEES